MLFFLWNAALEAHATKHGVQIEDAEYVIRHARPPYPEYVGDEKFRIWGRTVSGEYIQVLFVFKELEDIEFEQLTLPALATVWEDEAVFVTILHAMPLTADMKKQFRK